MNSVMQDLRYGCRSLVQQPGFTLLAVLMLALGIGTTAAMFSVVNVALIRLLALHEPESRVWLTNINSTLGFVQSFLNPKDILVLRDQAQSFEPVASRDTFPQNMTGERGAERVESIYVTPNFFRITVLRGFFRACLLLGLMTTQMLAQPISRAESVVTAAWVKALLDYQNGAGPRPAGYQSERFVILEASWATLDKAEDYRDGHLPGAFHLNTDELENGYPRWLLRSVPELQRVIGAHGITPQTTVIVYGKQTIAAARVWWVLNYAGVADVRLLNGGLAAWQAAGYPVETNIRQPQPTTFTAQPRAEWLATTDYVRTHQRSLRADARSHAEFIGEKSGYSYMNFKGRLPNAIAIGDADDAARLYVNNDGSLRDLNEVRSRWE